MKKIYFGLLAGLLSLGINAQEVTFDWAKSMGGTLHDYGHAVTTDASGNIFSTGRFDGTADFDPSSATYNLTTNGRTMPGDAYVQKLDANGNFLWAKSFGNALTDEGNSIATDAAGNVYVIGTFRGKIDFDPGSAIFELTASGNGDAFILKLDGDGKFKWATQIGGTGIDKGFSITIDKSGNVLTTGYFSATADFDPGSGTANLTANSRDIFIQKLSSDGNYIWAKAIGGSFIDVGNSITTDASNNVLVTGSFKGNVDFDPGSGVFKLTAQNRDDAFIVKLDASGSFVWAKDMNGSEDEQGNSITTDIAGNIYSTGHFRKTVDFDPGTGIFNLTSNGFADVYVQKLKANGDFAWAKNMGGTSTDEGNAIAIDALGNVFTTGFYQLTADFDPSTSKFELTSAGGNDLFIQKLTTDGDFVWAKSIGAGGNEAAESIHFDKSGNLILTGVYLRTVDFDFGPGTSNLTAVNGADIFILKLKLKTSGVVEMANFEGVNIYPNPNTGQVNVDLAGFNNASIKVLTVSGQMVYFQENISNETIKFNLNGAPGMYFLEVSVEGKKQVFKLIKQ